MGAKESKPLNGGQKLHSGFVTDAVPQSATLISDDNASNRRSHQRVPQQQAAAAAAAGVAAEAPPLQRMLPVVIRYKAPDTKARIAEGQQLYVITASGNRFPMSRSDDNYFAIMELPPGDNAIRFMSADGSNFIDVTQPSIQRGNDVVNVVNVNEVLLQTKDDDDAIDDLSGWGQDRAVFEETRKYPPMLPPHLRYTPLNAPPTQMRVAPDGSMVPVAADNVNHLDAEHLPLPLSVTINHIYFQRREDHTITGITTRYRDKYTTVAYYRGGTAASSPVRGSVPIPTA